MNFKTKALGIVAAAAFSLSLTTGVMAADEVSTGARVNLHEGECAISIDQANVNFGGWEWDGDSYEPLANGTSAQSISGSMSPAAPSGSCTVTVSSEGLTGQTNSANTIAPQNISVHGMPLSLTGFSYTVAATSYNSTMGLQIPNTVQPDEYKGTVKFAVVAGA